MKHADAPQMPTIPSLDAYRAIYHQDDIWRPAIETICRRHSFLKGPCHRAPDGSHIVYFAGQDYVIKLFVPLFAQDFVAESLVAKHLAGNLAVKIPKIVAEGQVAGWDYLVMTRIPGVPLLSVWDSLPNPNRQAIAADVGRLIAHLRALPLTGLDELAIDWGGFLAAQITDLTTHHPPVPELAWDPKQEIAAFFTRHEGLIHQAFQPVLLMADITREHIFVERVGGEWRMIGYLDFGDAMVGHPDYEMVAPGLEIGNGEPEILRSLLLATGYSENALNRTLSWQLMCQTLIHRFVDLAVLVSLLPQVSKATSLDELARLVWPLPD